jgi:membrane associated rhomboid family serine protease
VSSRFSRAGRDPHDPWFRIGTVDFNTTNAFTLLQVIGLFVVAVEGTYGLLMRQLPLVPDDVVHGQVWRVATWPFFTWIDFWHVATIVFFWYFGTQLERLLGRHRTLVLYATCTVLLSVIGLALSPFVSGDLYGLELLEFMVLLLFIAEHPHARFFFNIPAWLLGIVLVGVSVLGYLADRNWFALLSFVIGLYFCAIVGKSVGILGDYRQIPSVNPRFRSRRTPKVRQHRPHRPSRSHSTGPTVVAGPWESVSKDQRELDALLDKISQHGVESLTEKDRDRMMELRERIRRQG